MQLIAAKHHTACLLQYETWCDSAAHIVLNYYHKTIILN